MAPLNDDARLVSSSRSHCHGKWHMACLSTTKPVSLAASLIQWTLAIDRNQHGICHIIQPAHTLEMEPNEKPSSRKASTCAKASMDDDELLLSFIMMRYQ